MMAQLTVPQHSTPQQQIGASYERKRLSIKHMSHMAVSSGSQSLAGGLVQQQLPPGRTLLNSNYVSDQDLRALNDRDRYDDPTQRQDGTPSSLHANGHVSSSNRKPPLAGMQLGAGIQPPSKQQIDQRHEYSARAFRSPIANRRLKPGAG